MGCQFQDEIARDYDSCLICSLSSSHLFILMKPVLCCVMLYGGIHMARNQGGPPANSS